MQYPGVPVRKPCALVDYIPYSGTKDLATDFHPKDDECGRMFSQLFRTGTTNRKKGEYEEGGGKG
jgi:hypothetical protein